MLEGGGGEGVPSKAFVPLCVISAASTKANITASRRALLLK